MVNQNGFTLFELILVIAILGMLAVSVAPQVGNIAAASQTRTARATAMMVQSGINTFFTDRLAADGMGAWPGSLDAMNPDSCNVGCFTDVLTSPLVTADWRKNTPTQYEHIASGLTYEYDNTSGSFTEQ